MAWLLLREAKQVKVAAVTNRPTIKTNAEDIVFKTSDKPVTEDNPIVVMTSPTRVAAGVRMSLGRIHSSDLDHSLN